MVFKKKKPGKTTKQNIKIDSDINKNDQNKIENDTKNEVVDNNIFESKDNCNKESKNKIKNEIVDSNNCESKDNVYIESENNTKKTIENNTHVSKNNGKLDFENNNYEKETDKNILNSNNHGNITPEDNIKKDLDKKICDSKNIKTNLRTTKNTAPKPVPRKKGPSIADIKKALAEKEKLKIEAEKEAKARELFLKKEKDKRESELQSKIENVKIVEKQVDKKKLARFSFLRKDVIKNEKQEIETKEEKTEVKDEDFLYKSPITCILGHVDTGKTKLLDKLRHSNVQLGEAGGITQQIGATFFPRTYLKDSCNIQTEFPGILIIDTPGHESFTNLRSRGSSVCNIAILVIDIMHSLEPQTLESIEMLKMRKTPFVIALNKIDRIYKWKNLNEISKEKEHEENAQTLYNFDINRQEKEVQSLFKQKYSEISLALSEKGLNTALFYENTEPGRNISIIPTSAVTGEGIPDLFSVIINLSDQYMKKKLLYNQEIFDCTVLEVKNEEGHGMTVDAILSNGFLKEGDKVCLCGFDGPILTTVKTILVPEPCKEIRAKPGFICLKKVNASLGVKITGLGLEKVICGTSIIKVEKKKEKTNGVGLFSEENAKKMVMEELHNVLNSIQTSEIGVHVQASTLGSLEALLNFLKEKVPVSSISIGNLRKKDIIKASTMIEKKSVYALMLCFDIKVEKEMEELASEMGVKIFSANIIYHLLDSYEKYIKEHFEKKKEENKPVYPCKISIIAGNVWNKRSPIVMGVEVEGILTVGAVLTRSDGFVLGKVTSIENNKKVVLKSITGDKVAIKVETEETPRMLGRHFEESDVFYSKLTRSNIDVLKEFYKEDLSETDIKLIIDIKRIFEII